MIDFHSHILPGLDDVPTLIFNSSPGSMCTSPQVDGFRRGNLLTIARSKCALVALPRHVPPRRFETSLFDPVAAGYVPILTHPERLLWLRAHHDCVHRLVAAGVWIQVTAGALAGGFGCSERQLAERLLDDGLVHIRASDAHDDVRRRPDLRSGCERAAARISERSAWDLVATRLVVSSKICYQTVY